MMQILSLFNRPLDLHISGFLLIILYKLFRIKYGTCTHIIPIIVEVLKLELLNIYFTEFVYRRKILSYYLIGDQESILFYMN